MNRNKVEKAVHQNITQEEKQPPKMNETERDKSPGNLFVYCTVHVDLPPIYSVMAGRSPLWASPFSLSLLQQHHRPTEQTGHLALQARSHC